MRKVVTIVQARMGSSRLPGKVLRDMAGKPLLDRVLERLERCRRVQNIVVATTNEPQDDAIVDYLAHRGIAVVRGPEDDVLSRFAMVARQFPAEVYVRVTADSPLLSPTLIDQTVDALAGADYVTYALEPRTFPLGLGGEAFTAEALFAADREDTNPAWREHVTPFLYRHPERFRIRNLTNTTDQSAHRWTVDTPEDFELCRRIWDHFGDVPFDTEDILLLLNQHPDWSDLNVDIRQKKVPT